MPAFCAKPVGSDHETNGAPPGPLEQIGHRGIGQMQCAVGKGVGECGGYQLLAQRACRSVRNYRCNRRGTRGRRSGHSVQRGLRGQICYDFSSCLRRMDGRKRLKKLQSVAKQCTHGRHAAGPPRGVTVPLGGSELHTVRSVGALLHAAGPPRGVRSVGAIMRRRPGPGGAFRPRSRLPLLASARGGGALRWEWVYQSTRAPHPDI